MSSARRASISSSSAAATTSSSLAKRHAAADNGGNLAAAKAAAAGIGVGAQQAKKRVALGNLTNQGVAGRGGFARAQQVKETNVGEFFSFSLLFIYLFGFIC